LTLLASILRRTTSSSKAATSISTTWLVTRRFAAENPDLVSAVNAAFVAEAEWASAHPEEAEYIGQRIAKYSDVVRDRFIAIKRRHLLHPCHRSGIFVAELQKAADWLVARKILQ
jgi:sulfonate transport system substrate-binding protein